MALLLIQALNGVQLGLLLFLIAAGLTLVFGVMDFINLAHGVQYMLGAYLAVTATQATGSFWIGVPVAVMAAGAIGLVLEFLVFRQLYGREHLDQVLATLGIVFFLNEAVRVVWGSAPLQLEMPSVLSGSLQMTENLRYPIYRVALIAAGLGVAATLAVIIQHTRIGMRVRAGASNPTIISVLGVDIYKLFRGVFGVGAMLAGFAGALAAPLLSVEPGMGDNLLILAFVVIVIGGIGSIRGAFIAAILVGLVDTVGRGAAIDLARLILPAIQAAQLGPALASMAIYLVMALVLAVRPAGLFPAR